MVSGIAGIGPRAAAEWSCDGRVFGVEAAAGHLVEISSCPDGFGAQVEVDAGDWRGYHAIFGVRDGDAAIVYAVTADGELWWRRQAAAGAALSPPARIGSSVYWATPTVFTSRAGYLHIGGRGMPIRTFRHQKWASGGATVAEDSYLFGPLHGPSIAGLGTLSGYAIGIWNGMNFRVWRVHPKNMPKLDEDVWYRSGSLPVGLTSVVGDGHWLHAVNSAGEIVLMIQTLSEPSSSCLRQDLRPWEVIATAQGSYVRVVVPVRDTRTGTPYVSAPPLNGSLGCPTGPGGEDGNPWEWQSGGI